LGRQYWHVQLYLDDANDGDNHLHGVHGLLNVGCGDASCGCEHEREHGRGSGYLQLIGDESDECGREYPHESDRDHYGGHGCDDHDRDDEVNDRRHDDCAHDRDHDHDDGDGDYGRDHDDGHDGDGHDCVSVNPSAFQ
jgi:hypothetical protein